MHRPDHAAIPRFPILTGVGDQTISLTALCDPSGADSVEQPPAFLDTSTVASPHSASA